MLIFAKVENNDDKDEFSRKTLKETFSQDLAALNDRAAFSEKHYMTHPQRISTPTVRPSDPDSHNMLSPTEARHANEIKHAHQGYESTKSRYIFFLTLARFPRESFKSLRIKHRNDYHAAASQILLLLLFILYGNAQKIFRSYAG